MAQDVINNDLYVTGTVSMKTLAIPQATITDAMVQTAVPAIDAPKLRHQYVNSYQQKSTATAVADQQVKHIVRGAGTIESFWVGSVVANIGAATVTFDLWKNGSSVLSATISLTSSNTAYVMAQATLASNTIAIGDVLEVKVTVAAGGGTLALGPFARLTTREDPQ